MMFFCSNNLLFVVFKVSVLQNVTKCNYIMILNEEMSIFVTF
jgi:hypothetical protein